jgi:hypothetical protein
MGFELRERRFCGQTPLQYNQKVITAGAQTERRLDAGPVSPLLGGECSPAAFLVGWAAPTISVLLLKSRWAQPNLLGF